MAGSPDSLRVVLDRVFSGSEYRWRGPTDFASRFARWWHELTKWLDSLAGAHPRIFQLLIIGLVAVLVLVAVHAIWTFLKTTAAGERHSVPAGPVEVVKSAAWYRERADRLASEGQYAAALQARFFYLAIELDARRRLQFRPSKTPFEYSLELEVSSEIQREFGRLVSDLYRFVFGGVPCRQEDWVAWRDRASIERYVRAS